MSTRFGLNLFALVAAGFVAIISRTFSETPLEWTAFGVSTAVLVAAVVGLVFAGPTRGAIGYGLLGVVATWSLVAALVFSGSLLSWLTFADALGVALVALAGLAVHEVTTERVVHTLEIREQIAA